MSVGTTRLFSGTRASLCRLKEKLDTILPNPYTWKLTQRKNITFFYLHVSVVMQSFYCRKRTDMYAGNTDAKSVMCISTHFVFPCSTYQCVSKGSSIQYYNFTCSVASKKLGVSAEGKKEAVIGDSGVKEKIWTQDSVSNDGCKPRRCKDITMCSPVLSCKSFGEKCYFHLQGREYYIANIHHNWKYLLYKFQFCSHPNRSVIKTAVFLS